MTNTELVLGVTTMQQGRRATHAVGCGKFTDPVLKHLLIFKFEKQGNMEAKIHLDFLTETLGI